MYEEHREELYQAHMSLEKYNLVEYTSGNISVKIDDYILIKPSGVPYDKLTPKDFVVVDTKGNVIEGNKKPSVDTATHLYIYRHRTDVGCVIHTHSPYASAFAILGETLPVYSTAQADVFGGEIPITAYAAVGTEAIGEAALKVMNKAGAVLLNHHGVLVVGKNIEETLRKAIFLEEVAKTAYLARTMGNPKYLDESETTKLYEFHNKHYGQTKLQ
ncbi:L-ribulose-5-phosphate 4-epimerase [Mesoaciditoga lauensis]|uniref:L-ribulose-5-phosphate 4-epimerase n=1 Tax=Mesoaciditoga lauensis TaxID=1495039 RepID=UPI0005606768|nr:L-ribulose-5-phosphate 4-epimerase [Mesoaciditoga lauensis]